jgi:RpiB/LacA/LacB family sugar-phosphate isomerase
MKIAIGCDHAGFPLKTIIIETIQKSGQEVLDIGTFSEEPVDYPDYAEKVGRAVQRKEADRGIIVCGSGVGAAVATNKLHGIRAGLCHDTYSAHQSVEHDNVNILALGARVIGSALAIEIVKAFLGAQFSGEPRHIRRLKKVLEIERSECEGDS